MKQNVIEELDAKTYWDLAGKKITTEVAELAGTTYEHYKHIAHKRRTPSMDLARSLVTSSCKINETHNIGAVLSLSKLRNIEAAIA